MQTVTPRCKHIIKQLEYDTINPYLFLLIPAFSAKYPNKIKQPIPQMFESVDAILLTGEPDP